MINFTNHKDLTLDERRAILARAVASQPFFELLEIDLLAGVKIEPKYQSRLQVNKDFYVTQVIGNFDEVFNTAGAAFDLSIWTAENGESIHKYISGEYLPSALQVYDARFNTAFNSQIYCDLQYEIAPYLVGRGDAVLMSVENVTAKNANATAKVCLGGYFATGETYLNNRVAQGVNESLAGSPDIEIFELEVTESGIINKTFSNDRFARLVLGFGVTNLDANKNLIAESNVLISDNVRGLKLNNTPLPIEFFAPRFTCLRDTHIYYLPIEHFFEPFATLRFDFDTNLNGGNGFRLQMVTRKV